MTIRETDLQKDVVDSVRAVGGAATKLSNRFLVGVCDLLIKLPDDTPAMLMEVKKNTYPIKSDWTKLEVTKIQEKFLCDFAAPGMTCGVMSFLIGPKRKLWVHVQSIADAVAMDYLVDVVDYREIPLGQRGQTILKVLQEFVANYERLRI